MRNYLVGEDNKFISYFNNAKRQLIQDGESTSDLITAFGIIFDSLKSSKLVDSIRGHDDGEVAIRNFTTKKIPNQSERADDEDASKFLNNLQVSQINESGTISRLRGFGGLKFGESFDDLPDYEEAGVEDRDRIEAIDSSITFTETFPSDMDKYNPSEPRYSYGNEHFKFVYPKTNERLVREKLNFITRLAGQEPDFVSSKSKTDLPKITRSNIKMPLPKSIAQEMSKGSKIKAIPVQKDESGIYKPVKGKKIVTVNSFLTDEERRELSEGLNQEEEETGNVVPTTENIKFKPSKVEQSPLQRAKNEYRQVVESLAKEYTLLEWTGAVDIDYAKRDDDKVEQRVYDLKSGGHLQIVAGSLQAGKVARQIEVPESALKRMEKVVVKELKDIENNTYKKMQENPLKVYNYRGVASIKTNVMKLNTLAQKTAKQNDPEQASEYEYIQVDGKNLTVEQAGELESRAWEHKETGDTIANSAYVLMEAKEKARYKPTYTVVREDGVELTPSLEESNQYTTIKSYRMKDAPENSYARGQKVVRRAELKEKYRYGVDALPEHAFPRTLKTLAEVEKFKQEAEPVYRNRAGDTVTPEEYKKMTEKEKEGYKLRGKLSYEDAYDEVNKVLFKGKFVSKNQYNRKSKSAKKKFALVDISPKQFAKLPITEQELYEPITETSELRPSEVRRRIRQNKRKGKQMQGEVRIDTPDVFGDIKPRAMSVTPVSEGIQLNALIEFRNIDEAFANCILSFEIVIEEIGEFKISPMQRKKNDEMVEVLEDIKENYMALEQKLR